MDMTSDFENMDVLLGNENANLQERELGKMIKGSIGKMTSSLICILGQNSLMKLKSETTTTKASLLGMIEFWNQCKHYQMKPT